MDGVAGVAVGFTICAVAYGVPWALYHLYRLTRRALRRRRPHVGAVALRVANMPPGYRVRTLIERNRDVVAVGEDAWLDHFERELARK